MPDTPAAGTDPTQQPAPTPTPSPAPPNGGGTPATPPAAPPAVDPTIPKARFDEINARMKAAEEAVAAFEAQKASEAQKAEEGRRAKLEAEQRLTLERDEQKAAAEKATAALTAAQTQLAALNAAQDAQWEANVNTFDEGTQEMLKALPGTSADKLVWLTANRARLAPTGAPVPPTVGGRPATTPPPEGIYQAKDTSAVELRKAMESRQKALHKGR